MSQYRDMENRLREEKARQEALAASKPLTDPFLPGGQYSPERLLALFNDTATQDVPVMQPASAGAGVPYAQTAMDLASRSASIQAGNAAQGLSGGLNPAARSAALSEIARGASSGVGAVGAQAYGQGLGMVQNANATNTGNLMQERMGQLGLFGQGLQGTYGMAQGQLQRMFEALMREKDRKAAEEAARDQAIGSAVGTGIGMLPILAGAPPIPLGARERSLGDY